MLIIYRSANIVEQLMYLSMESKLTLDSGSRTPSTANGPYWNRRASGLKTFPASLNNPSAHFHSAMCTMFALKMKSYEAASG